MKSKKYSLMRSTYDIEEEREVRDADNSIEVDRSSLANLEREVF